MPQKRIYANVVERQRAQNRRRNERERAERLSQKAPRPAPRIVPVPPSTLEACAVYRLERDRREQRLAPLLAGARAEFDAAMAAWQAQKAARRGKPGRVA